MTIFTHILATTLGVQLMGLHGGETVLAYTFGVAVDVDHAVKAPFYLKAVGLANKRGYYWRSSLQEPVALLWILPLCLLLRTPVPAIFFLIHVAMDYSVSYEKMPWYPYSPKVTQGWLLNIPDKVKEGVLVVILICSNLLLFLARR
jgi:hypothetical protein